MFVPAQYAGALRALLMAILPQDSDFVAFCTNSFLDIAIQFPDKMDPQRKLELFIEKQPDPSCILVALRTERVLFHQREVSRRVSMALEYVRDRKLRPQAVVWMLSLIATEESGELFAALEVAALLLVSPHGKPQDLAPLERWLKNERSFTSSSENVDDRPSPYLEDWPILILTWQALYAACWQVDVDSVERLASCLAVLLQRILPLGKKCAAIPRFPIEAMAAVNLLLTQANKRGTALHATLTNLLVRLCVHNDRLSEALPVLADVPESSGLLYASSQIAESWILRMRGDAEKAEALLAKLLDRLYSANDEPPHRWMSVALSLLLEIGQEEKLERAYGLAEKYAGPRGQAQFALRLAELRLEAKDHKRAATWTEAAENAALRAGLEMLRQQSKLLRCNAAFNSKEPYSVHRATIEALVESFSNDTENRHALGQTLQLRGQWRLRDHSQNDSEQLLGLEDLHTAESILREAGYLDEANRLRVGWSNRLVTRGHQQLENAQYAQACASLDQVVRATPHVAQMQPIYEAAKAADHFAKQCILAQRHLMALREGSEEAMAQVIKLAMLLVPSEDTLTPFIEPWMRLTFDIGEAIEYYALLYLDDPDLGLASKAVELKTPSDVGKKYTILEALCPS